MVGNKMELKKPIADTAHNNVQPLENMASKSKMEAQTVKLSNIFLGEKRSNNTEPITSPAR